MPGSLLGLGMGTFLANFHICCVIFRLMARLRISVRYWMASGPRCFKWRMFMWSGPVELLLDDLDIASKTCVAVMYMGLDDKALVCLSTFLFVVFVACWMVLTNCLLKEYIYIYIYVYICTPHIRESAHTNRSRYNC